MGSTFQDTYVQRTHLCKSIGCTHPIDSASNADFCAPCLSKDVSGQQLSMRYPNEYKSIGDMTELDVFAINQMFQIQDPSGCLQHAIRKLLLSGGQANPQINIREARDTLTRWLQLNQEP